MNINKGRKIICCILIVFVAVVAVVFATRQNSVEIQAPDATKDSPVVDTAYAAENKANDNTSEEVSDEATEEETQEATADQAEEASVETTKKKATATKKEPATKKTETTTKAVETTTKSSTTPTSSTKVFYYNGVAYKPYEVFVNDSGNEVYYNEGGILIRNISVSGKTEDRDSSRCYECGSKECQQSMSGYHCVVCNKDISPLTCHPQSHYDASH